MMLSIKAPAKINLALDVLRKREDGYHDVDMIMTTIDLADRVDIRPVASGGIYVSTTAGFLPEDERNLAYQAAHLFQQRFAIKQGVAIHITKNIPVAAGLAGGSSDAAAVLRGLNRLWQTHLAVDELAELGAAIGSDVAFCVYGGTARATGRGEKIERLPSPPPCWVVLARPEEAVSTKETYEALNLSNKGPAPDIERMKAAIISRNYEEICRHLGNVLEKVTIPRLPEIGQIKRQMTRLGADGVLMSGSGPTVFGFTLHESRARKIYNGLRGFCTEVYKVRLPGDESLRENVRK